MVFRKVDLQILHWISIALTFYGTTCKSECPVTKGVHEHKGGGENIQT